MLVRKWLLPLFPFLMKYFTTCYHRWTHQDGAIEAPCAVLSLWGIISSACSVHGFLTVSWAMISRGELFHHSTSWSIFRTSSSPSPYLFRACHWPQYKWTGWQKVYIQRRLCRWILHSTLLGGYLSLPGSCYSDLALQHLPVQPRGKPKHVTYRSGYIPSQEPLRLARTLLVILLECGAFPERPGPYCQGTPKTTKSEVDTAQANQGKCI